LGLFTGHNPILQTVYTSIFPATHCIYTMKNTTLHTHTNLDSITYTMTRLDVDVATVKLCMRLFMSGASTHSDQIQIKE